MSETAAGGRIVVERLLPHPPAKVWTALTTAELIGKWLMALEPVS